MGGWTMNNVISVKRVSPVFNVFYVTDTDQFTQVVNWLNEQIPANSWWESRTYREFELFDAKIVNYKPIMELGYVLPIGYQTLYYELEVGNGYYLDEDVNVQIIYDLASNCIIV
jgi:hypothetical protein